jgi:hypothetical protein
LLQRAVEEAGRSAVLARVTRAVVVAEILVLAGCSTLDRAYYTVSERLRAAFPPPHHTASASSAVTSSANTAAPPPPPYWNTESTPVAKPTTTTATATAAPVEVNGLSGKAVRALLGQPATRAGPAPGETWTYRSGSCQVDLYLFPDVTHGGLHVLDHRVSGTGSHTDGEQACLRRMRDGQNG